MYAGGYIIKSILRCAQCIAYCHNELLNKAHELTHDYILVVDFHALTSNISVFVSNFRYNTDDGSVIPASASDAYYNVWAARTLSDSILNFDVWRKI